MTKTSRAVAASFVVAAVVLAAGAGTLLAAEDEWPSTSRWPRTSAGRASISVGSRSSPAGWCSWLWVKTTDWVSTDCQELKLNYFALEPDRLRQLHGGVRAGVVDSFFLGRFSAAGGRLRRAVGDLRRLRNKQVDNDRRAHAGAPALLVRHAAGQGGSEDRGGEARSARSRRAGEAPGRRRPRRADQQRPAAPGPAVARLDRRREIVAEGLAGRASAIMLDYTQQGVAVRTMVDGVWISAAETAARERPTPPWNRSSCSAG